MSAPRSSTRTGTLQRLATILQCLRFPERTVLLALLLLGTSVSVFLEVADRVGEGRTQRFDERVLRSLRNPHDLAVPIGPAWVNETARDITALGGPVVVTLVAGGVVGYFLLSRHWRGAILVASSVVGGVLASYSFKQFFARARPSLVPHLDQVSSFSFPSGHSILSAVTYLTIGA